MKIRQTDHQNIEKENGENELRASQKNLYELFNLRPSNIFGLNYIFHQEVSNKLKKNIDET